MDLNIFQGNFLIKHEFLAVLISSVSKNLYENKIFNFITTYEYTNNQIQPNFLIKHRFLAVPISGEVELVFKIGTHTFMKIENVFYVFNIKAYL